MVELTLVALLAVQQAAPALPAVDPPPEKASQELFAAVERGDIEKVRASFVYVYDKEGRSALHVAAEGGQKAAFSEMLSIANEKVKTAVVVLPAQGQPAVVPAIVAVQKRAEFFDKSDSNNVTPLMLAAWRGWDDVVKVLLDGGASALKRDKDSRSAADYAEIAGFKMLAEYLRSMEKAP